jgi:outer membrane receptor protein involved in Fe transport
VNANNDISVTSISAEWNEKWGDRLRSVIGVGAVKETVPGGRSSTTPIGNAGLDYVASDLLDVRLSSAQKVRTPSVSQRYDSVNGNVLLKPEQTTTVELGFRHQLPDDGLGELTFFRTSAQDFIDNDPFTNIATNRSRLVFSGFEIALKQQLSTKWQLQSSYSFLRAKDKSASADTAELQYRPRHKLTLDAALEVTPGLLWSNSASLVAGQVVLSRTTPTQSMDVSRIALFATRLQWRANRQFTLYAGVDNLFDRNFETSYGFPQRGRFAYAGADVRF